GDATHNTNNSINPHRHTQRNTPRSHTTALHTHTAATIKNTHSYSAHTHTLSLAHKMNLALKWAVGEHTWLKSFTLHQTQTHTHTHTHTPTHTHIHPHTRLHTQPT